MERCGAVAMETAGARQTYRIVASQGSVVQTGSEISDHTHDFIVGHVNIHFLEGEKKAKIWRMWGICPELSSSSWNSVLTWAFFSLSSCC